MKTKWILAVLSLLALAAYAGTYAFLYAIRGEESSRFKGQTLPPDFVYAFDGECEELTLETEDGGRLSSVLFKADSAKGVVCFWKGNGGTLRDWAPIAPLFLDLGYDVLLTDYRQHGKSRGQISLENFYADAQLVYDSLKRRYPEDRIVVAGFSLGGRIAAHLAAGNAPRLTVLLDPASTTGDFSDRFLAALYAPLPPVTGFNFETEADVQRAPAPVAVVGTGESPHSVAHRLKSRLRAKDRFFEVPRATHGTLLKHKTTQRIITQLLQ